MCDTTGVDASIERQEETKGLVKRYNELGELQQRTKLTDWENKTLMLIDLKMKKHLFSVCLL